jgi:hypothetical protein
MNSKSKILKVLQILHLSFAGGLILFAIIAVIAIETTSVVVLDVSVDRVLQVVAVTISLTLTVVGFRRFSKGILEARNMEGAVQKRVDRYRAACILWWAMIEIPAMLSLVCFILTANYAFFALAMVHILILLVFMPRAKNIMVLLKISEQELNEI